MSEPTSNDRDAEPAASGGDTEAGRDRDEEAALNEPTEDESDLEDEPPDESTLMGKSGVEEEVLAELARVESELADPNAPAEPEGEEEAEV